MFIEKKAFRYTVKEEKNKHIVNVFNDGKLLEKIIIPTKKFKEDYSGYTRPSRAYAFDLNARSFIKSPDKVGYTGHDTFFEIKEEGNQEVMTARLLTQFEWDFLCGKDFMKDDASPSNYKLFLDIKKLYQFKK